MRKIYKKTPLKNLKMSSDTAILLTIRQPPRRDPVRNRSTDAINPGPYNDVADTSPPYIMLSQPSRAEVRETLMPRELILTLYGRCRDVNNYHT